MTIHADKMQKHKNQSGANEVSQKRSGGKSAFQFAGNRPEAIAQREPQEMANNSPQVQQGDAQLTPEQQAIKEQFYGMAAAARAGGDNTLGLGRMGPERAKLIKTNPGMVANAPQEHWSIQANNAFIQGGLEQGSTFLLWTKLNPAEKALVEANQSEPEMTKAYMARKDRKTAFPNLYAEIDQSKGIKWSVFATELAQLRSGNYRIKKVGDQTKAFPGGRTGAAESAHIERMKLGRKKSHY